ncbi:MULTISPECIES: DUF1223 domain-containing protein [unclassified Chitinophaga]|uniref:DUF1223 domain-containing protein n=1 Tax=unclassified Chitinophaga TaxID=2619133 RepID=UPI00300F877F
MKLIMIPAIALTLFSAVFANQRTASEQPIDTGNGFAVLELFTSEGCSSCPPADALLARIQQEAGNKPIYILAYHVDYWNRLGWKDIFSDLRYSKRQYQYSQQLNSQVYTPQLVINGTSSCVGSDEAAVTNAMANALASPAEETLNIKAQLQSGKAALTYNVTGDAGNSRLLVAVVQKHAVSKVTRGENEGRMLSHVQIVRDLRTFDPGAGSAQISLPGDFNTQEWELIGMIQDSGTGVIKAATRVPL